MAARADEGGAFPVLEAVLAAALILSTIVILSVLQRPVIVAPPGAASGPDEIARGAAIALGQADIPGAGVLETWLTAVVDGDPAATAAVHDFVASQLPAGAHGGIRVNNGVAPLTLIGAAPAKAAGVGVAYALPNWRANDPLPPGSSVFQPGDAFDYSSVQCLRAPTGLDVGPGGQSWLSIWNPASGMVPLNAIYGVWVSYTSNDCVTGPKSFQVVLAAASPTELPPYGVELVVWTDG
jgi:hypothetical protein